jgi:GT2 family glycosyltransferase
MDLSIIIVSWNTRELLSQCLQSIYAYPPQYQYDITVVDNASTDGSQKMVQDKYPQVHLLSNADNVGFSRANNQGIRQSQGRIILLLNSDTRVHPGALQELVTYLNQHMEVGIAGARLLNVDDSIQYYPTNCPNLANQTAMLFYLPGRREFSRGLSGSMQPCEVERVQGAFLAIRREVTTQIGLMEESLFLYAEEDDLCQRARTAGWQVAILPQVVITHHGGASTEQTSASSLQHLYRSKIWFIRKYHGAAQAILLKIVLAISCLIRGVAGVFNPSTTSRRRAQHYLHLLKALHTF